MSRAFPVPPEPASARPAEARWFVPGRLPEALTPPGQPQRRCDEYDLVRLAPDHAVKRRGRRHVEWKLRTGRVELIEIAGVIGFAERWLKARAVVHDDGEPGDWLAVRKQVWRRRGAEVCALDVAGEEWWSVAVSCQSAPPDVLGPWQRVLRIEGVPSAYPSWLLTLVRRQRVAST